MRLSASLIIAAVAAVLLAGCHGSSRNELPEDAVAVIGARALTAQDIRREVPRGLSPGDSATFVRAYIRGWIDRELLSQVAVRNVDMDLIDQLVEDYRNELIMTLYRREMSHRVDAETFSEDTLRAYYESHPADFILERPLVKGVYLKVEAQNDQLARLKRLYRSERPVDIDDLEKIAPTAATHYDYFRDRWIDWEQIENRIPADIPSADAFLNGNRTLQLETNGFCYLLHVTEFMPTGARKPFEAAVPEIQERLINMSRRRYDTQLRNDLYQQALSSGELSFPNGDPLATR